MESRTKAWPYQARLMVQTFSKICFKFNQMHHPLKVNTINSKEGHQRHSSQIQTSLKAALVWNSVHQLKRTSLCNKCWWQIESSCQIIKMFCYILYFSYCHHAKRKMSRFLWSLYKILRPPSPLGLWQNFRRNIFWGTKQGTNMIFKSTAAGIF